MTHPGTWVLPAFAMLALVLVTGCGGGGGGEESSDGGDSGSRLGPVLSLSTASVAFPDQTVGTISELKTVQITNTGDATLIFESIEKDEVFPVSGSCGAPLPPQASCILEIRFAPLVVGRYVTWLVIRSNAIFSLRDVMVSGSGVPVASSGIWRGKDSHGNDLVALVSEVGEFGMLAADGTTYSGKLAGDGASVLRRLPKSRGSRHEPMGDGEAHRVYLRATVSRGMNLLGQIGTLAAEAQGNDYYFDLSLDPQYRRAISLASLAGTFRDQVSDTLLSIDGGGNVFAQDPATGCVINGSVTLPNPANNIYRIRYQVSGCTMKYANRNGREADALGTVDSSGAMEVLWIIGGDSGGYSITARYERV